MKKKLNVAIVFGGKSAEHEVSIRSAQSIFRAMDKKKYSISLIGINKNGLWFSFAPNDFLKEEDTIFSSSFASQPAVPFVGKRGFFIKIKKREKKIDVVFPVLHGPFGEDGTIQGLFKLYNVAFVGPSVLGSAIGMDKDVSKRLLKEAGLPTTPFLAYRKHQKEKISFVKAKKTLGTPIFIKPANLGSSVGISKVNNQKEFLEAIETAFRYDRKIILEKFIAGQEIECSVLGNENPKASTLGEICPNHDFYSYEAKYLDKNGAGFFIPAKLKPTLAKKIRNLAIKAFEVLNCEGMGRVDFFIKKDNKIFINEINTIPGFTSISMYPKLWEHSGIKYPDLIDELIELAVERHKEEEKLKNP